MKRWLVVGFAVALLVAALGAVGAFNALVALDQDVQAQWAQVENVYQRRADLVPNLVETVKGAAAFERETFLAVAEARAAVGRFRSTPADAAADPQAFRHFMGAQDQLSSALTRLLAVSERYPTLRATDGFRDLQAQLEGTENRITVERQRFNEAARAFNTRRQSFPTFLIAGAFGGRFREKPYFHSLPGAARPPSLGF